MKKTLLNRLKIAAIISLMVSAMVSCKKLIEIPSSPPNELSAEQLYSDSANVMGAIAGIYNNFNVTNYLSFHSGGITVYTGLSGDELINNNTDDNAIQFANNAIVPNNQYLPSLWSNAYSALYLINASLDGISTSTGISASLKAQLTGEIKVVRALYYFNLVNLFGDVPLITSTNYKITASLPRASADSVYAFIISDLTDAKQNLTADYPSDGRARPNLYVASALLAKVYLYRQDWQKAFDMANEVINSGQYQLEPDLNNVFLDGSIEAIWQLPANGANSQTVEALALTPYTGGIIPNYTLSPNLINAFEPADSRFQNWVKYNVVDNNGTDTSYYYAYKYKNRRPTAPTMEDYMIIRLGELLLIRAESLAHLNNVDDALSDLNQVRNRAGLPNTTTANQTNLLSAIMHERQTELFCEWGNRWYDLKRTGTIDAVLSNEKTNWQPTDALYPIPLTDIRSNPNLKQNPGY